MTWAILVLNHILVSVAESQSRCNYVCIVNGGYSDWTYWTQCSVTCGGGIKTRYRNCSSPEPAFGGKDCAELGVEVEKSPCAPDRCPGRCTAGPTAIQCYTECNLCSNWLSYISVSGGYSEWGDWTNCTAKCGGGEQFRTRTCTNPVPEFGGNDCTLIGESTEKRECNKVPCPGILSLCYNFVSAEKCFEESRMRDTGSWANYHRMVLIHV